MMTNDEVAAVAAMVMESQGRQVSSTDLTIWTGIIGDLPPRLAQQAAMALLRESDGFISHQAVRQRALALANERVKAIGSPPTPPSDLSPEEYERWQWGWKLAAINGASPEEVAGAGLAAISRSFESLPALTNSVPSVAVRSMHGESKEVPHPLF